MNAEKPFHVAPTSPLRYLLPKDLPAALSRLDGSEAEVLLVAEVKPSTIARQFGITEGAVQKALASEARRGAK
jgi:hypothetical protein